jgi:hypothetical protein
MDRDSQASSLARTCSVPGVGIAVWMVRFGVLTNGTCFGARENECAAM